MSLDLNMIWFGLIGFLFAGYLILDGFDLGVGVVHLLAKKDEERRIFLSAIGPVWDGNEVWLVTAGGALFAAFPLVYATVFSGFYLAFMFFLLALIFRVISVEFRSKRPGRLWRGIWDHAFSISSFVILFLLGVCAGNLAQGIPLNHQYEYTGGFLALLGGYPLLVGCLSVVLMACHGCVYLLIKTEAELRARIRTWTRFLWGLTGIVCACVHIMTFTQGFAFHGSVLRQTLVALLLVVQFGVWAWEYRGIKYHKDFQAFLGSTFFILTLLMLFGLHLFPFLVYSHLHPEFSLTIYNAASSPKTLKIMLWMAGLGLPMVLFYTFYIYRIFRGKVHLESAIY